MLYARYLGRVMLINERSPESLSFRSLLSLSVSMGLDADASLVTSTTDKGYFMDSEHD